MKLERTAALGAVPYLRPGHRKGHTNGVQPDAQHTLLGL
jgi:hypothetical protein